MRYVLVTISDGHALPDVRTVKVTRLACGLSLITAYYGRVQVTARPLGQDNMTENSDIPIEDVEESTDFVDEVRDLFTYDGKIIIPDRGTINFTITVDSATPDYPFTISDADGNLLGDGVISELDFAIESYHINNQPETPPQ